MTTKLSLATLGEVAKTASVPATLIENSFS